MEELNVKFSTFVLNPGPAAYRGMKPEPETRAGSWGWALRGEGRRPHAWRPVRLLP